MNSMKDLARRIREHRLYDTESQEELLNEAERSLEGAYYRDDLVEVTTGLEVSIQELYDCTYEADQLVILDEIQTVLKDLKEDL